MLIDSVVTGCIWAVRRLCSYRWGQCLHHCEWVSSFSVALIEHHEQKGLGEERVYFSLQSHITVCHWRNSGQAETEARPRRSVFSWLAPLCFLYTPDPLSQGGHCPWWAGLSHINHHSRECPRPASHTETFFFLRSRLLRWLHLVSG